MRSKDLVDVPEIYKGYIIEICYDTDPIDSPGDWDDHRFIVAYHRDFWVEKKNIITREEAIEIYDKLSWNGYWVFKLEAYIHGGVVLALSNEGNFPDRQWDVSQLGLVLIKKDGCKTRVKARKAALSLIETWNQYLSGDIYGFRVLNKEEELIESCWGFYGDEGKKDALSEAKAIVDVLVEKNKQKHIEKLKAQIKAKVPLYARKTLEV